MATGAIAAGVAEDPALVLDRLTWGANSSDFARIRALGTRRWLDEQLRPEAPADLPPAVQAQIAAMRISQTPPGVLRDQLAAQRRDAETLPDEDARKAALHDYQLALDALAREAAQRSLLRDLYSPRQLQEQMTWFWLNHFSVHQNKHMIRALVGDYEDRLRAHALGRFRDLIGASAHHPAMLVYLDNAQNVAAHRNENYARELLELHTMGVDGGYTQRDVQELARVLTGFGIRRPDAPVAGDRAGDALFEFHARQHDFGDKVILGRTIRGRGAAELDEVLDLVSRQPSTARFVCAKLARFLVREDPEPALVESMAAEFRRTDGDIAAVLRVAIGAPQFARSLHQVFKDPMHYVVSAVRMAYDERPIANAGPMIRWLARLGEPLYGHPTPEGYALGAAAWDGPGQLAVRFEIAKAIGSGSAGLFHTEGPRTADAPAFPQLANAFYYASLQGRLASPTRQVLDRAASPQEWNQLLLSSPEFMLR